MSKEFYAANKYFSTFLNCLFKNILLVIAQVMVIRQDKKEIMILLLSDQIYSLNL